MHEETLTGFYDEMSKIAGVSDFLTRTPYGGALLGAAGGAGVGAGVGALTGKKGERKKRALYGAGIGAGIGGLGGAAVGAARKLPVKKVLQHQMSGKKITRYSAGPKKSAPEKPFVAAVKKTVKTIKKKKKPKYKAHPATVSQRKKYMETARGVAYARAPRQSLRAAAPTIHDRIGRAER